MEDKSILDTEHWQNLRPPLSPNEDEVDMYKHECRGMGPICMLGMTKELVQVCDYMVDLNPIPMPKPVILSDWKNFDAIAEVVIGDGVLNLAGMELVDVILRKHDKLVCRVFTRKLHGMKYATHFPTTFPGARKVVDTQPDVLMVVWERR